MHRATAVFVISALIAAGAAVATTTTDKRMQPMPVLGRDPLANATTVFPYSYNPSWFVSPQPEGARGCMLVRVQNYSHPGDTSPGPSKMAASCVTKAGDAYLSFSDITADSVVFQPSTVEERMGTEDPRLAWVPASSTYLLFFTAVQLAANGDWIARLSLASNPDPLNATGWTRHGALFPDVNNFQFTKSGALLVNPAGPSYLIFGDCSLYNGLQVAVASADFLSYTVIEDILLVDKRPGMFDAGLVESGPPPMQLADGNWLFIYNAAQSIQGVPNRLFYNPGYVILNGSNPLQVLQRSSMPLVMPSYIWETQGLTPYVVFVEAMRAGPSADTFVAYYGAADTNIGALLISVTSGSGDAGYTVSASSARR